MKNGEHRKTVLIEQVQREEEKKVIARLVLQALPDWFGIPEARERYIEDSVGQLFLAAKAEGQAVGFLCLKETGDATVEIAVMGVLPDCRGQGIGKALVEVAKALALEQGYGFLQVKTVQMGWYDHYDQTNRFYLKMGFRQFELLPTLWDEKNPCQVYILALR